MSKQKTSQTQQDTSTFDPMQAFHRLTQDNLARFHAFCDELAGWETRAREHSTRAVEQMSELMNESLTYAGKLAQEWRTLTLEATRRGAELFRMRN